MTLISGSSASSGKVGADPEEIERSIVLVIEDAISGIEGIDEISSSAKEGLGSVTIEALSDADLYLLAQDISKEVDRITTFPEEAEEPEINVMASKRKTVRKNFLLHRVYK
jgi:multidrug efflux pump subunit AcrB